MPATLRRKKHASTLKRQKPKHRKTQSVKKKSSFQQRKQARPKPVAMTHGKNSSRNQNSPALNDAKILRQLQRSNEYMTNTARGIMISFVKNLYRRVSTEAERLRKKRNRPSIGSAEMRTALKSVIPIKRKRSNEHTHKNAGARSITTP
ncbi:histone H2B.4-like [Sphaerodactylus townsendi]|uniref:histone H2B.4-like n=1 Tax=Sphaerodactylus townsendi TaxID=933632 RepID=UPI0020264DD3|nr:histone H2B.4-like [Sphaerodactylus townsendi]